MRIDPWKLAALVLFVACVDELVRPDVAHAPGIELAAPVIDSGAGQPALEAPIPTQSQRD